MVNEEFVKRLENYYWKVATKQPPDVLVKLSRQLRRELERFEEEILTKHKSS